MVLTMLAPFQNPADPDALLELPIEEHPQDAVPGWPEMQSFLRDCLGIRNTLALKHFCTFYNFYLRRFPVHYFTEKSIPGLDFVFFLPSGPRRKGGINRPHYFVAMKPKNKPLVLFRRSLPHHMKTTKNFHRMSWNWLAEGYPHSTNHQDITEIVNFCDETAEQLLPMLSIPFRSARFEAFLQTAQRKLKRANQWREFREKWGEIREYLNGRDRVYIEALIARIRTQHISIPAAQTAKAIDKDRNIHLYNWMLAGADDVAVRNRIQVGRAFPWLASMLTEVSMLGDRSVRKMTAENKLSVISMNTDPTYRELEKVIDQGDELIPALQEAFSNSNDTRPIRASTVRKMLGLRLESAHQHLSVLGKTLQGIDRYAPDFVLKQGYFDHIAISDKSGEGSYAYLNSSLYEILGAMGPEERDHFFCSDPNTRAYGNVQHFLVEVYSKLVLPYFTAKAIEYGVPMSDMAERYIKGDLDKDSFISRNQGQIRHPPHLRPFGNMSFMNMVRLSEAWHDKDNQKTYLWRRRSVELPSNVSWPALTPEITAPNGVKITPRTSQKALMDEVETMNNCLHGFAPNCLGLREEKKFPGARVFSHIFAMAAANTRASFGLFEVHPLGGGKPTLHIDHVENKRIHHNVENHASANSPESVAAKWFFNEMAEGRIKIDWQRLQRERYDMRMGRKLDDVVVEIGFDPSQPKKKEQAFLALRPFLPDRFRTASYAEWAYKMDFENEARQLLIVPMGPRNNIYTLNHVYD